MEQGRAALYIPEKEGDWATIDNFKKEGRKVRTKLHVNLKDPAILKEMKREATKLGMSVDKVMTTIERSNGKLYLY